VRFNVFLQDIKSYGSSEEDINPATLQPINGDLTRNTVFPESFTERYNLYNAVVNWDLGFANLTSSTSYSTFKAAATIDLSEFYNQYGPYFGVPQANFGVEEVVPTSVDRWTEEIRLTSPADHQFEWQLGSFLDSERTDQIQNVYGWLLPQRTLLEPLFNATLPERYFEYAFFGDVDYYFTPDIDLAAGLRWSRNDQHFTAGVEGVLAGGDDSSPPTLSAQSDTTFSVSPRWHITPDAMVYVRVASGYRPGGPNAIPPDAAGSVSAVQKSDTVLSYEVGTKTDWLDHRLTLDLSAFYVDWSDVQLTSVVNGFGFGANGGAAESEGLELQAAYRPLSGLTLGVTGSYTNAILTKDAPGVGGLAGDRLPTVPRWGTSATVDYTHTLFGDYDGVVGASLRYVGSRMSDFSLTGERVLVPAYDVVDLRLGIEDETRSVTFYVKNLFDERGFSTISDTLAPTPGSPYQATVIQPLTFGLSFIQRF
jgi:outer membrane receptor protein involved in Fe transport